ncbi:helix-turn-helix transcriptional regulator [Halobacterium sp. R2-5]|uniref:helix-turn-helix transcriptional regulator n=1 Tax=Halobacterium sp. R2-5 TaxID=2715751 RepID=UPI001422789B|nr:helix-turn-helix transcriptional regulator [Halobacterium sp. R2-5]NIB98361.1 helix-turn-helix transcriptional regulator [Halobacterium sp. R2-5]
MSANSNTCENSGEERSLNAVFSALSHPVRRHVLATIHDPPTQASGEFRPEDFVRRDGPRERPVLELYHNHLPRLDSAGFVDWDDETNTVTRGPRYAEIESVLSVLQANSDALPGDWP